jgi:surface protein
MADKAGKVRSKKSKGKKGKGKSGKVTTAPNRASTDGPTAAPSRAPCTSANSFDNTSLQSAVDDYFEQECLTNKICDIIIKYGDIGGWKTCEVTEMSSLFDVDYNPQAVNFTESLNNWDVSKVTTMRYMFYGAKAYNQPMDNWDVSKVTDMDSMFRLALAYNQPLKDWDVSKVTTMRSMFSGAKAYNQPMDNWNVSKVTDMNFMFYDAAAFNQNLCAWGNVASFPYSDVYDLFANSGCTYKANPTQATKGPFCADDCTAVFV